MSLKPRRNVDPLVQNLSSEQIAQVLDTLVFGMVEPIVRYSDLGFELAASLLALMQNNRRKVCEGDRSRISSDLMYSLCFRDRPYLFETLKTARFERNILVFYAGKFISYDASGAGKWSSTSRLPPGLSVDYAPLRRHLLNLMSLYSDFRNRIVKRYDPVILNHAKRIVRKKAQTGVDIKLGDAEQNCRMAALKALDKFQISEGVLTKYLIQWVSHSVSSSFAVGEREAFTLTRSARTQIAQGKLPLNNRALGVEHSFSVADSSPNVEISVISNQNAQHFLRFLRSTPYYLKLQDAIKETGLLGPQKKGKPHVREPGG